MPVVTCKLTEIERIALEQVVQLQAYKSTSDALRAALDLLFEHHQIKPESRRKLREARSAVKPRRMRPYSR